MKFLFKIFFIFSLVLFSCSTPEQRIVQSFKQGKLFRYNREIRSAEIYDTIYTKSVLDSLPIFEERLDKFYRISKSMSNVRDSISELHFSKTKIDSLIRKSFERIKRVETEADHLAHQKNQYYIFYNTSDTICGYYAKIYTKNDTFDVVVDAKRYSVICPTFIFKNESPGPRRNFN
jgi:hypothetical protein